MMLNGVRNRTWFPLKYGLFKKVCNKKMLTADQLQTRRVLSETKAIMSPPYCHWMESKKFVVEGEIVN